MGTMSAKAIYRADRYFALSGVDPVSPEGKRTSKFIAVVTDYGHEI
jgi:hypothetical protein